MLYSLIKIALATFAVSVMITSLAGPFGIFERTRVWIVTNTQSEYLHEGIQCPFCAGTWIALVFAIGYGAIEMWLPALGLSYAGFVFFKIWHDIGDYVDHATGRHYPVIELTPDDDVQT